MSRSHKTKEEKAAEEKAEELKEKVEEAKAAEEARVYKVVEPFYWDNRLYREGVLFKVKNDQEYDSLKQFIQPVYKTNIEQEK